MSASVNASQPDFGAFVERRLDRVRSGIRANDLLMAVVTVFVGVFGYALLFVLCDHWLVPGGLPVWARWCGLALLLAHGGWWGLATFWRASRKEVNSLYAAREIEKASTELKDSLLTWVDLQHQQKPVDQSVWRALERRTAAELSRTDAASAIDSRSLLQWAVAALGIVVVFSAYALLTPKKLAPSLWRMVPFAPVEAPTRTQIRSIEPGSTSVVAGGKVEVKVELAGDLPPAAELRFSTADGKFRDELVPLRPETEGAVHYRGWLAGENGRGLLQPTSYRVIAGDATSATFAIDVRQPPTAKVVGGTIVFPPYMQKPPEQFTGGTIDGYEGAVVTLQGQASGPTAAVALQLLDDPAKGPTGEELPAKLGDSQRWEATWTLAVRSDGTRAAHYRALARSADDVDPAPTLHSLQIRSDLPPEVAFLQPDRDVSVPANAVLPLLVEARDPDFLLGFVHLHIEKHGQAIDQQLLSEGREPRVLVKHRLELERLRVNPGDVLEIFVEAFDNREPRRNRKASSRLRVTIVEPVDLATAQEQERAQEREVDQKQRQAEREQAAEDAARGEGADEAPAKAREGDAGEGPRETGDGAEGRDDQSPSVDGAMDSGAGREGANAAGSAGDGEADPASTDRTSQGGSGRGSRGTGSAPSDAAQGEETTPESEQAPGESPAQDSASGAGEQPSASPGSDTGRGNSRSRPKPTAGENGSANSRNKGSDGAESSSEPGEESGDEQPTAAGNESNVDAEPAAGNQSGAGQQGRGPSASKPRSKGERGGSSASSSSEAGENTSSGEQGRSQGTLGRGAKGTGADNPPGAAGDNATEGSAKDGQNAARNPRDAISASGEDDAEVLRQLNERYGARPKSPATGESPQPRGQASSNGADDRNQSTPGDSDNVAGTPASKGPGANRGASETASNAADTGESSSSDEAQEPMPGARNDGQRVGSRQQPAQQGNQQDTPNAPGAMTPQDPKGEAAAGAQGTGRPTADQSQGNARPQPKSPSERGSKDIPKAANDPAANSSEPQPSQAVDGAPTSPSKGTPAAPANKSGGEPASDSGNESENPSEGGANMPDRGMQEPRNPTGKQTDDPSGGRTAAEESASDATGGSPTEREGQPPQPSAAQEPGGPDAPGNTNGTPEQGQPGAASRPDGDGSQNSATEPGAMNGQSPAQPGASARQTPSQTPKPSNAQPGATEGQSGGEGADAPRSAKRPPGRSQGSREPQAAPPDQPAAADANQAESGSASSGGTGSSSSGQSSGEPDPSSTGGSGSPSSNPSGSSASGESASGSSNSASGQPAQGEMSREGAANGSQGAAGESFSASEETSGQADAGSAAGDGASSGAAQPAGDAGTARQPSGGQGRSGERSETPKNKARSERSSSPEGGESTPAEAASTSEAGGRAGAAGGGSSGGQSPASQGEEAGVSDSDRANGSAAAGRGKSRPKGKGQGQAGSSAAQGGNGGTPPGGSQSGGNSAEDGGAPSGGGAESGGSAPSGGGQGGPSSQQGAPTGGNSSGGQGQAVSRSGMGDGTSGSRSTVGDGSSNVTGAGDAANTEYNRQAAELVLQRLQEDIERGDVDQQLLDELGWTRGDMERFADRLARQLRSYDAEGDAADPATAARRQQFEEMLKTLDLQRDSTKRTQAERVVREVDQSATRRTAPPPEYRRAYDAFTRGLSKRRGAASGSEPPGASRGGGADTPPSP